MERVLAILVEMWISDDWQKCRLFVMAFGAIVFVALVITIVGINL